MAARGWLSWAFLVAVLMQESQAQTAPTSFRDEYASVNGVRLHYVSAGGGTLILFLHGFPEFWYEWRNQLAEFGKDHLAVAPDMRGYNLSDKPEALDQYLMGVLVEDVRALTDRLAHGHKFVLVGHDWGGAVAWAFAIAHPEMLGKLVIINAPHPGVFGKLLASDPAQQKASNYMLMFRGGQAEQTLSADNYSQLVRIVLGEGLQKGIFTENDKAAYIAAWWAHRRSKLLPRQPRWAAVAGWHARPRQSRHRFTETHRQRSHTGNLGRER